MMILMFWLCLVNLIVVLILLGMGGMMVLSCFGWLSVMVVIGLVVVYSSVWKLGVGIVVVKLFWF